MSYQLVAPSDLWNRVRADLLSTPQLERAAVGFAGITRTHDSERLLLRDWVPVPHDEYLVQLGYHLEVSPRFWARHAKRARRSGEALVVLHSHPRSGGQPRFSASDTSGEATLVPKLQARAAVPIAAVVVGPEGLDARVHGPGRSGVPGLQVRAPFEPRPAECDQTSLPESERFDRQRRAVGSAGQRALAELRVGVVGLGGTGSHVIQQLAHLGIGEIIGVDPDRVETSNLSRVVGSTPRDARWRRRKVSVARRLARRIGGPTRFRAVRDSVLDEPIARSLLECDVLFGCTDTQWSRAVLNALAFQYYVPLIDMGVEIQPGHRAGGRVTWLEPGGPCLWCMGILSPDRVRAEQLPKELRALEERHGYIVGMDEPAPAVVSLNGVVASLAVTELLARITEFASPERSPLAVYSADDGTVRRAAPQQQPGCPTCNHEGMLGAGDLAQAPWRPAKDVLHSGSMIAGDDDEAEAMLTKGGEKHA